MLTFKKDPNMINVALQFMADARAHFFAAVFNLQKRVETEK